MADRFYKIKENDFEKYSLDEIVAKLDDTTRGLIESDMFGRRYDLLYSMINCESPIERILVFAMVNFNLTNFIYFNPKVDIVDIVNQDTVKCGNKTYRVDFGIVVYYPKSGKNDYFIVECDGHNFYEKTKEQVIKNNHRDRDLMAAGYKVIHFSGSEIYKGSFHCITEIVKVILKHAE